MTFICIPINKETVSVSYTNTHCRECLFVLFYLTRYHLHKSRKHWSNFETFLLLQAKGL